MTISNRIRLWLEEELATYEAGHQRAERANSTRESDLYRGLANMARAALQELSKLEYEETTLDRISQQTVLSRAQVERYREQLPMFTLAQLEAILTTPTMIPIVIALAEAGLIGPTAPEQAAAITGALVAIAEQKQADASP